MPGRFDIIVQLSDDAIFASCSWRQIQEVRLSFGPIIIVLLVLLLLGGGGMFWRAR